LLSQPIGDLPLSFGSSPMGARAGEGDSFRLRKAVRKWSRLSEALAAFSVRAILGEEKIPSLEWRGLGD
jgi:hypothetical protein